MFPNNAATQQGALRFAFVFFVRVKAWLVWRKSNSKRGFSDVEGTRNYSAFD